MRRFKRGDGFEVEWGGLEQIMKRMGFHPKWINIIMQCLSSVTCSIWIKGVP